MRISEWSSDVCSSELMGAMSLEIAVLQRELEAVRNERDGAELATAEKIANALDEVAGNLLRDRTSDAIDGYNAAVMIDFAATIRRDFRAALSQPVQPVEIGRAHV